VSSSNETSRAGRKRETRRVLEEALDGCLRERGYEATTVADVARAAGVATGTFYVHFPSKEAALDARLSRFHVELESRLASALAPGRELRETVRGLARVFLEHWGEHRWLLDGYVRRVGAGLDEGAVREGLHPPLAAWLGAALAARGVPPREAELAAHGLLGLWLRVGLRAAFDPAAREAASTLLVTMSVGAIEALGRGADR
jgi:AcrR family transcriptional regulator